MAIIVGDIHGNVEKVRAFLEYRPDQEHIALGDYVDSFSEPVERQVECLQLLLDSNAVLLWGNHDLHYLEKRPFVCTGFQYGKEDYYIDTIYANKDRFLAAYVADGWLCTHAGVNIRLAKRQTADQIAARLNKAMQDWLHEGKYHIMFDVGQGRGGPGRAGGIFWYDFKRESGIDLSIKQIFGHTETPEPVINMVDFHNIVALDTTNNKEHIYLFDTQTEKLVVLPMPHKPFKRCKECQNAVDFLNDDGTCTDCGK